MTKPNFCRITPSSHPKLWTIYLAHPEILYVFENIQRDLAPSTGIAPKTYPAEMLEIYVKELFLPTLLENFIIFKDDQTKHGYRPGYDNLHFTDWNNRSELARMAKNHANSIADQISPEDEAENTVLAFVSGRQDLHDSQALFKDLKELLNKHLNKKDNDTSAASHGWRLAIIGKVLEL